MRQRGTLPRQHSRELHVLAPLVVPLARPFAQWQQRHMITCVALHQASVSGLQVCTAFPSHLHASLRSLKTPLPVATGATCALQSENIKTWADNQIDFIHAASGYGDEK